jgi:pimeloyl-ACP methyl ester carboxylesterase
MKSFESPSLLKMRNVGVLLSLLLCSGCATPYADYLVDKATNPPSLERLSVQGDEALDLYSIDIGPAPRRAVFFVSGSGCASLGFYLRRYFKGLTGSWTIYAVQKRGVETGETGFFCSKRFRATYDYDDVEQRDEQGLEEVMRRHPEGLAGLIGVSEGGPFATDLAARHPQIPKLVVIGSGGQSFRQDAAVLDARNHNDRFAKAFADVASDPQSLDKTALGYTHRYWSTVLDRAPAPVFLKLKQPILMILGEKDESVPIESGRVLERRFAEAKKTNLRLIVIPGANHVLVVDGQDQKPAIMKIIGDFLEPKP